MSEISAVPSAWPVPEVGDLIVRDGDQARITRVWPRRDPDPTSRLEREWAAARFDVVIDTIEYEYTAVPAPEPREPGS